MNFYNSNTYNSDLLKTISSVVGIQQLKNSTILITGATGTIGSYIVDTLLKYNEQGAGIRIIAANYGVKDLEERFSEVKNEYLSFVDHNILSDINWNFDCDYIIHTAGFAFPDAFSKNPVGTIWGNVSGTYKLLEYGRTHGAKRLLYISSGEVYGQGDLSLDSFDEKYSGYIDPTSPRSCYPESKRTTETLCASYYKQYGLETVMVRPCHTYGPCITPVDNRAHAQFIRNALAHENIIMKSAGTQMRSYCYIGDCASAILTVLINGNSGESYNSANPDVTVTIAELANAIASVAGVKVIFEQPSDIEIANQTPIAKQVLSTQKLAELGWNGSFSLVEGIEHTLMILQGK
ncbi:MAG: NAD-dependent epimerase/dehydratase family protein [Ruminococcus sp.]|nr:NAD-dependent epimerase/dehydratase family protein [Ruminococcus sp.]